MKREQVKERVQETVDELKSLRDEIQLDLHLASMELRDEWSRLEGRLPDTNAVNRLKGLTKDAIDGLTQELRAFKQRLRDRHGRGEVAALMTRDLVTCAPSETLAQAITRMWDEDIGWLPVVEDGRLVGTVTDRDACVAACTRGKRLDELTVDSVMSYELATCSVDDTVERALAVMRAKQLRRLPVLEDHGSLVGVITLGDLARALALQPDHATARSLELVSTLAAIYNPPAPAN